jgi:ribonuclease J
LPDYLSNISALDPDTLYLAPLGGQSELGQVLWVLIYQEAILLVDAGATFPNFDLPGVDLLLPNTNFLEANQDKVVGLALTNGHEEHAGGVVYLASHVKIPKIMAPNLVVSMIQQGCFQLYGEEPRMNLEGVTLGEEYRVGPYFIEWVRGNNAVSEASCLKIACAGGTVLYTSGFKFEQTPTDGAMIDLRRLSTIGDEGVDILISDSSNVEATGYCPSENIVETRFYKLASEVKGRFIVVMPATNTYRLRSLFDTAQKLDRKVILLGETLQRVAISAAMTGHLHFEPRVSGVCADLTSGNLKDEQVLVVASSCEADPIRVLEDIAFDRHRELSLKAGDTVVFSSEIMPGELRHLANILDQLLLKKVVCVYGKSAGVHVSKHAAQEELKCMLSIAKPRVFLPAIGEGRHIARHAELAHYFGLSSDTVFTLKNGEMLGYSAYSPEPAEVVGEIESQSVLFNREQGERVTTASVNERRALSMEGIVSIGISLDEAGNLLGTPSIECGASGFLLSRQWAQLKAELPALVEDSVGRTFAKSVNAFDPLQGNVEAHSAVRSVVRESVVKALRSRMGAKPTVHVTVHQLYAG